jgi:hypothetical protein
MFHLYRNREAGFPDGASGPLDDQNVWSRSDAGSYVQPWLEGGEAAVKNWSWRKFASPDLR